MRVLLLLVVVGVVGLFPAAPASSQTSASTSTLSDGGVLRLRLGATDQWMFQPTVGNATGEETQVISPSGACGLTAGSLSGPLSKLTAEGGSVGFVSDGLGVRGAGEGGGQSCGRIDGTTQKLILELGSRFTSPATGPKRAIDFAEIDVEGKFNAIFQVTGTFGSTTKTETYDTLGSDSGPDSGDNDNYRIRFPKTGKSLFTKLTFSVLSGGISVEGGADGTDACGTSEPGDACVSTGSLGETILDGPSGTPTKDSLFHLIKYDRTLSCGDTETQSGGTTVPTNTLLRLANADDPTTCQGVLIDLEAMPDQQVSLRKDLTGQAAAQFSWTVTWLPEDTTLPVKVTQFDFGAGFQPIQWCLADGGDTGTFPDRPPTASTTDDPSALDPWCLTSQHSDLNASTGKITVKEIFFGVGDPGAKR